MHRIASQLERLSSMLNRIAMVIAVLAILVMLGSALWQVVARYLLAAPPIWTEELARRAMVWAGMMGAACAFRAGTNPTLFPAMLKIGGGPGIALSLIRAAGVLLFAIPVLWYSVFNARMDPARGFLGRSLERTAEMLPVSMIWFTSAVPLAFLIILIHLLALMAKRATGAVDPKESVL